MVGADHDACPCDFDFQTCTKANVEGFRRGDQRGFIVDKSASMLRLRSFDVTTQAETVHRVDHKERIQAYLLHCTRPQTTADIAEDLGISEEIIGARLRELKAIKIVDAMLVDNPQAGQRNQRKQILAWFVMDRTRG
jgi:predicted HTH transcriptional regulator